MPSYRFCFHSSDASVTGEEYNTCSDDDTAVALARTLLARDPVVMIWHGERFVRRVSRTDDDSA